MTFEQACKVLQISKDATLQEAQTSYDSLREQYRQKQFEQGRVGNEATKNLDKIDEAIRVFSATYQARQASESGDANGSYGNGFYSKVEQHIKNDNLDAAQEMLDDVTERDAEWHYMQSVVYYKKSWYVESKKQLETCVKMEPDNPRYKNSLDKLNKILSSKKVSPDKMSGQEQSRPAGDSGTTYTDNGTCTGSCCGDICLANMCCDCCNCICTGCR